jgi:hypothetical protein
MFPRHKKSVQMAQRRPVGEYTRGMHDVKAAPGLLRRGWRRMLDGDRPWGSLDIHPDRFGITRYRLVVFPPGISAAERRRVRVARGWTLWAALVWFVCQVWLSQLTGPRAALAISTAVYFGLGLLAATMAGDRRRQVRTMGVMVMAGHHDQVSAGLRDKLEDLACAMLEADESLKRGEITATNHEMTWWRVYDQIDPASAAKSDTGRGA